jgi:hypothetical protein
VQAST